MTYRDPEPSKQALEIKTPPLVKRWWMRPICLLLGHHWHWTRWSAARHHGDIRNHLPDAGFGADKFCRRCGAESYRCEDATSIGFQRVGNQWDTDIVRTIKP